MKNFAGIDILVVYMNEFWFAYCIVSKLVLFSATQVKKKQSEGFQMYNKIETLS